MITLDTNVISETMRVAPEGVVIAWLAAQRGGDLYITAISEAELRYGLAITPPGKRRRDLAATLNKTLDDYRARVLPFNGPAAAAYSEIAAKRRATGSPIMNFDCQIAAIAKSVGAKAAARDVGGFDQCGVDVVNPWEYRG